VYICLCVSLCVCLRVLVCLYIYVCVCVCVCVCVSIYVRAARCARAHVFLWCVCGACICRGACVNLFSHQDSQIPRLCHHKNSNRYISYVLNLCFFRNRMCIVVYGTGRYLRVCEKVCMCVCVCVQACMFVCMCTGACACMCVCSHDLSVILDEARQFDIIYTHMHAHMQQHRYIVQMGPHTRKPPPPLPPKICSLGRYYDGSQWG